ncbi:MAG: hypothetical protein ACXABY_23470 [Candidatus Thorarchaeota archaeon]|jgi:hypothetical protein
MGTYGSEHNPVILDDIELLKDQIKRDTFDGFEVPTQIVMPSISGTIDPFTEEVTTFESTTYFNASGVVGQIAEDDMLLGVNGKVIVGDTSIVYHYDNISGALLQNNLNQIQVLATAASGLYHVSAHAVETFANLPIYVKVALKLDENG